MIGGIGLALNHQDANLFDELYRTWQQRRRMNAIRSTYFDGEAALKDFGISLPPQMRGINSALGWTAKGVRAVTDRSKFEGFVSTSEEMFGVDEIAADNQFEIEFPGAQVSSAVHGPAFLTVSHGDLQSGEPDVQVIPRAADMSAAVWDRRRRRLKGFLSIVDVDRGNHPTHMVMYTPEKVITLTRQERIWSAAWVVTVIPNPLGRVSVAPLVYGWELLRPLGHSRITRASMGYVDSALRTIVRSEVSSEFYSAVEYWLFGADVESFVGNDRWSAVMGRIKAMDTDSNDSADKPDLHRFNGASPQPHVEQLRMWANLFADDQDLEVKFADSSNPSSADAIFAAKETLITTTRDANTTWGVGAVSAMRMAVMLRDGLDEVPAEMRTLRAQFTDPAIVSPSARADAFSKLATAIDGFGNSEVGMEFSGLSREQIVRFQAEQRRNGATDRVAQLVEVAKGIRQGSETATAGTATEDANVLKAKFDALGVAVRAGVDPQDAAARLGLDGIRFTGATPVALRLPKDEAADLEER